MSQVLPGSPAVKQLQSAVNYAREYLGEPPEDYLGKKPKQTKIINYFAVAQRHQAILKTSRETVQKKYGDVVRFLNLSIREEALRTFQHFFNFSATFNRELFLRDLDSALESQSPLSQIAAAMIAGRKTPDTAPLKNWTWKKKLAIALPFALLAAGIITGVAIFLWRRHAQKTKALPARPEPTVKPPVEPVQPPPPGPNRPLLPRRPDPLADKVRRT